MDVGTSHELISESQKRISSKISLFRLFSHPTYLWRFSLTDTFQIHSVTQITLNFRISSYCELISESQKRISSKTSFFRFFSHPTYLWRYSLKDTLQIHLITQITLNFRISSYFELISESQKRISSKRCLFRLFSHPT